MTDPFARLGLLMARWRWLVVAIWLALLVGLGATLAPRTPSVLKGGGYTDPNSESAEAARILDREFNAATTQSVAVVFRSPSLTVDDPAYRSVVDDAVQRLRGIEQ